MNPKTSPTTGQASTEGGDVVAKKAAQKRDGVYTRKDRPGFWITWTDAQGDRRYRKTDAANITQAKQIIAAARRHMADPGIFLEEAHPEKEGKAKKEQRGEVNFRRVNVPENVPEGVEW
jgi:hypothetical protein